VEGRRWKEGGGRKEVGHKLGQLAKEQTRRKTQNKRERGG
jgi:hypothetical protein